MKVSEIKPWFCHPQISSQCVYIIFDVCHMVKVMQNTLSDYKTLCHDKNSKHSYIQWQYIDKLNDVQEDLGFSLSNKLKKKHILWTKHKMNVKVAAQIYVPL